MSSMLRLQQNLTSSFLSRRTVSGISNIRLVGESQSSAGNKKFFTAAAPLSGSPTTTTVSMLNRCISSPAALHHCIRPFWKCNGKYLVSKSDCPWHQNRLSQQQQFRLLSANTKKGKNNTNNDDDENKDIVLTPGQQVVAVTQLSMYAGLLVLGCFCAYYIVRELIPTKMSPNRVFDRSFELIKDDMDVKRRYGEPLKAYGRDHGGHREGRRNFVEHSSYKDDEDGSNRVRVRYNIEGRFGNAYVFAEVSSNMNSGEFVYVLVQDKANGRVHTVIDNRAALTASRLAAGSKEVQSAMSQLLTGGSSKK